MVCGRQACPRIAEPVDASGWETATAVHPENRPEGRAGRVLFSFRKRGPAVYLGHLDVMQIFERALLRSGYRSRFTEGFNPKPRIEFAQPLSLGIASQAEIALAEIQNFDREQGFAEALNRSIPQGFEVTRVRYLPPRQVGRKKHSLMSLYRGSEYRIESAGHGDEAVLDRLAEGLAHPRAGGAENVRVLCASSERLELRVSQAPKGTGNIHKILAGLGIDDNQRRELSITRLRILAHRFDSDEDAPCSYFDLSL